MYIYVLFTYLFLFANTFDMLYVISHPNFFMSPYATRETIDPTYLTPSKLRSANNIFTHFLIL